MAFEKRDMSGALFVNDRKEADNHPDRTGYVIIGGVEYRLSGWLKNSQRGQFLSLAVKPMEAPQPPPRSQARDNYAKASGGRDAPYGGGGGALDDEVPFAPEWR